MGKQIQCRTAVCLMICALLFPAFALPQSPIAVLHTEGLVHGFLVLSTLDGEFLADGEVTQLPHGDQITSHLILRFKDGSVNEETAVFSQRNRFRLISDHLVQKGPAFKQPMDVTLDGVTGKFTARYTDKDGKEEAITDHLKLPADISNGILLTLLKNIRPDASQTVVSMVAATPKPRLVKLLISPEGEDSFSVGGSPRRATRYALKVEIGGVAGVVAPLVGKQPPDTHVWILEGDAPVFVKLEGPFFQGGPIWRIQLTSPVWPGH